MVTTRVALAALLCGAALLSACGGTEPGTPTAGADGAQPPSTSAGPSGATEPPGSPDRPATVSVEGKDPCLLSAAQLATWGDVSEPRRDSMSGGTVVDGAPVCSYLLRDRSASLSLLTSADVGVDEFLASTTQVPSTRTEVDGFPAAEQEGLTSRPETGSGECYVMVDVADDQMLSVQFSQIAASEDKRLPIETLCAQAREVASAAMTTLQGG